MPCKARQDFREGWGSIQLLCDGLVCIMLARFTQIARFIVNYIGEPNFFKALLGNDEGNAIYQTDPWDSLVVYIKGETDGYNDGPHIWCLCNCSRNLH